MQVEMRQWLVVLKRELCFCIVQDTQGAMAVSNTGQISARQNTLPIKIRSYKSLRNISALLERSRNQSLSKPRANQNLTPMRLAWTPNCACFWSECLKGKPRTTPMSEGPPKVIGPCTCHLDDMMPMWDMCLRLRVYFCLLVLTGNQEEPTVCLESLKPRVTPYPKQLVSHLLAQIPSPTKPVPAP